MTSTAALLVVDDNEDNRYTLVHRLKRLGYADVTTAVDGREALEVLRRRRFDLVLLDIMMPEMDGYDVLAHMKRDTTLRDVPVVMISAVDEIDSVVRCIELGAEDYLSKPFNPILLRARVAATLEKKRLRDEIVAHRDRLEAELAQARAIQLGMVPSAFPAPTAALPVEIFATLEPAREIGGDLYDFFPLDAHTLCVVVGDVSDKGAPAALFMALTKSVLRAVATLLRTDGGGRVEPDQVVAAVNEELCRDNPLGMFVTLFLAMLDVDTGEVRFCNAGHPAPYVIGAGGAVAALTGRRNKPVGVFSGYAYGSARHALHPGDAVFIYTDGITEAVDATSALYGDQRLHAALQTAAGQAADGVVAAVMASVHAFVGEAPVADDVAALALRFRPPNASGTLSPGMAHEPA